MFWTKLLVSFDRPLVPSLPACLRVCTRTYQDSDREDKFLTIFDKIRILCWIGSTLGDAAAAASYGGRLAAASGVFQTLKIGKSFVIVQTLKHIYAKFTNVQCSRGSHGIYQMGKLFRCTSTSSLFPVSWFRGSRVGFSLNSKISRLPAQL